MRRVLPVLVAALALSGALPGALPAEVPAEPALAGSARTPEEQARIRAVTAPTRDFSRPEAFEAMPGGAATGPAATGADAFSHPSAGLGEEAGLDFQLGNALFRKLWVAAPASTRASDGLGPLYNARSCHDCHRNDGRGHPPEADGRRPGLVLHLSVPGGRAPDGIAGWTATLPDPVYGRQVQDFAAPGLAAEGRLEISHVDRPVILGDGTVVSLREPRPALAAPAFGPLAAGAMMSPRIAPQMIGLGPLEAIPAAEILALADPDDADGDGISGRPSLLPGADGPELGRFGLKAGAATVRAQTAAAFASDLGLSTVLHPAPWGDCTAAEAACRAGPHGQEPGLRDGLEVDAASLDLVTFYAQSLAVPVRRDVGDAQVLRGKQVFHAAGCIACHVPKHVTARLADRPELSFQLIWPYTDLLLHDMGPGLADGRPEGVASGQEWRTPPLWGIGATALVSGRKSFLHDGRARDLTEAILWHGGEGQAARDSFAALPAPDRDALVAFLESL